jgi:hypothetical protein
MHNIIIIIIIIIIINDTWNNITGRYDSQQSITGHHAEPDKSSSYHHFRLILILFYLCTQVSYVVSSRLSFRIKSHCLI